jgi:xanthine dehydrogenase accessory factor
LTRPGPSAPQRVSLEEAAAAASAAAAGGAPVAIVVGIAPAAIAGMRLLRFEGGRVRGSFGEPAIDAAAIDLADAALAGGTAGLHPCPAAGALYVEAHRAPERLVIVGAGHIAVPLAALGAGCGFRVTVLDDREAFATAERFDPAVDVRRADFEGDPFAGTTIDARSYVALVTRGHRWDFDCLTRLIEATARPRYIGMIGSRRRVRAAFIALRRAGVGRDVLAGIHAPIGLDIGAETPAEIAVSIMAELIQVRRGGGAESLTRRERVLERLLPAAEEADALEADATAAVTEEDTHNGRR